MVTVCLLVLVPGEGGEEGAPPDGPDREDEEEETAAADESASSVGSPRPAAAPLEAAAEDAVRDAERDMHIAPSPGCSPPPHPMIASDSTRPASLPASREDRDRRQHDDDDR